MERERKEVGIEKEKAVRFEQPKRQKDRTDNNTSGIYIDLLSCSESSARSGAVVAVAREGSCLLKANEAMGFAIILRLVNRRATTRRVDHGQMGLRRPW